MPVVARADASDDADYLLGGAILILLLDPSTWIRRRVESVSFLDALSMRRQVSVDFVVPGEDLTGVRAPVLPLALLEKQVLVDFDLVDEEDRSLPVLTRAENGYIAWSTLARAAQFAVQSELGRRTRLAPPILEKLRDIATSDADEAVDILERFRRHANRATDQQQLLAESPLFMDVAWDLALQFLLLVEAKSEPDDRRIMKFSYAQEFEGRPGKAAFRLASQMGWLPAEFDFEVPSVGASESYHIEFDAPQGLSIARSDLVVLEPDDTTKVLPALVAGRRAHAYVSGEPPESYAVMSIWLWPVRAGLLRASVLTAALTTAVFIFFLLADRLESISGNAASALLLAIPGLIAAFIVRPGEHGLVTDLVRGIRAKVAITGATAYAAALSLIGSLAEDTLVTVWKVLASLATLCFLSLLVAYFGIGAREPAAAKELAAPEGEESPG